MNIDEELKDEKKFLDSQTSYNDTFEDITEIKPLSSEAK